MLIFFWKDEQAMDRKEDHMLASDRGGKPWLGCDNQIRFSGLLVLGCHGPIAWDLKGGAVSKTVLFDDQAH